MKITFEEIKKSKPKMIYYSANTVFWTHDPADLKSGGVPLDCFGSPLFQTDKVKEFLDEDLIKAHAHAYGKDPVKTLMICHAQNIDWLRSLSGFHSQMTYKEVAKLIEESEKLK